MRTRSADQPSAVTSFLGELRWRGLIAEMSDGFEARLAGGRPPVSGYIGFDASARSLHVGNLVQVFMLTHLQRAGGTPYVVIGGGTGMIGDPSGKSSERNLLTDEQIAANSAAIRAQLERFVDFTPGPSQAQMVNNRDWLAKYGLLEFLRDVGKYFSVPYMLAKESVQQRLERGLSFTEFSYMTLQAADWLHLYRTANVELQMGGADQWGNLTAGLELLRRLVGRPEGEEPPAFALCSPLLLTKSGVKMGKSERGAIFLDAALTSAYEFYQYWLNDEDEVVGQHLRWLTLMTADEVAALEAEHAARPEGRPMQRALAFDLTARIHGREAAERQQQVAEAAFSGGPIDEPAVLEVLYQNAEHFEFQAPATVLELAISSQAFASNGEARRTIVQGGLSMNGQRLTDPNAPPPPPLADEWYPLRIGKKRMVIGRRRQ